MRLLILRPGSVDERVRAAHGDFDEWFVRAMRLGPGDRAVVDPTRDPLPDSDAGFCGILVTGSHAGAWESLPWIPPLETFLRESTRPVLGVCFGHQVVATAFGGRVAAHPQGSETGVVSIERYSAADDDVLLGAVPRRFPAPTLHDDHVVEAPVGARVLAGNPHSPVQAFRLGDRIRGVQFHPEISPDLMRDLLKLRRADGALDSARAGELLEGVRPTPEASEVLTRFTELVGLRPVGRPTGRAGVRRA